MNCITYPKGFWDDGYIIGFVTQLGDMLIRYKLGGDSWEQEKRGEVFLYALDYLCGEYREEVSNRIFELSTSHQKDNNFEVGADAALLFYVATYSKLKDSADHPILTEARALALKLENDTSNLGVKSSEQGALSSAIFMLTVFKHIKGTYL